MSTEELAGWGAFYELREDDRARSAQKPQPPKRKR